MASKKRAITINDVAEEAGVSPSTVSRILNGTAQVAPDKQAAVLEAIERLNYRPNVAARGLVLGSTSTVGVLMQHLGSPFFGEMMRGIEQGLLNSDYYPLFASSRWQTEKDLLAIDMLMTRRVDALILVGGQISDEHVKQVADDMPTVVVGRVVAGLEDYCIGINNFEAARIATRYLIDMGHTTIAHITGNEQHYDAVERRRGYEQALKDAGLSVNRKLIIEGDYTESSGVMAVERLFTFRSPFTAIFAANDQMAMGARLALYRRGIRVPEDVSLVGFDNMLGSAYMTPPLTTVHHPGYEMGVAASQAILKAMQGEMPHLPNFPVELLTRESVSVRR